MLEHELFPIRFCGVTGYNNRANDVVYHPTSSISSDNRSTVVFFGGDVQVRHIPIYDSNLSLCTIGTYIIYLNCQTKIYESKNIHEQIVPEANPQKFVLRQNSH